ncbi:hypothetical protein [Pseudodesulfovibrio sp. zrk46]|uniref:hypothetical protein n=1 Tax=Pseudodesulfovibrio sp. zrk46 TaxID=2725288 RepID=UPI001449DB7F|nr:hypothetical protein [Pseudodesulfovibrio sp. zrk46]QJB56963.1 hypothetical protein HFN16_11345 [Pseudodesulfovibrio sp. zrk46]
MKKLLPKNPLAAAGVGALVGAGIAGYQMWTQYKQGDVSKQEAIAGVVKQGLLFGGVAAASTFAGGQGGGGVGLAAMSIVGLSGQGGGGGGMLPGMIVDALGSGGGGGGQGRGRRGNGGGGQSNGLVYLISESIAEAITADSPEQDLEK